MKITGPYHGKHSPRQGGVERRSDTKRKQFFLAFSDGAQVTRRLSLRCAPASRELFPVCDGA